MYIVGPTVFPKHTPPWSAKVVPNAGDDASGIAKKPRAGTAGPVGKALAEAVSKGVAMR